MATTISAGNATNGAAISSDNTGTLNIATGPGSGTTAISIDASQAVTMPGNLIVTGSVTAGSGTGDYILQQYTSPTIWTKPTGLKAIKVTVVGAGGAGGPSATPATAGGGGGAGAVSILYLDAPAVPGPIAVTAGPGTNSFGPLASCTAGSASTSIAGGAGGTATGGTITINGMRGSPYPGTAAFGGIGASTILGTGGMGAGTPTTGGATGTGYGSGGGGANPTFTTAGSGAPGIVIVEEFY